MNTCEDNVEMNEPCDMGPLPVIELYGFGLRKYGT